MGEHITVHGRNVNRQRQTVIYTISGMADTSSSRRLKDNLLKLCEEHDRSINWVVTKAKGGGSLANQIKDQKPIGLDRLDRIAGVFGLESWQLLVPGLDPKNLPSRWLGREEAKKHAKLAKAQRVLEEMD